MFAAILRAGRVGQREEIGVRRNPFPGAGKRSKERKNNLGIHPFALEIETEQIRSGQQLTHLSLYKAKHAEFSVQLSKPSDSVIT